MTVFKVATSTRELNSGPAIRRLVVGSRLVGVISVLGIDSGPITGTPETINHVMRVVRSRQETLGADSLKSPRGIQIRMVAEFAETAESKEIFVAKACNHPNCVVLPLRSELIAAA